MKRAAALYKKGCDAGNGAGCLHLGGARELGRGMTKDKAGAADAYARGCALGQRESCKAANLPLPAIASQ